MQPWQCVSQHPVANLHLSTHVATSKDDNEAAIPMQSATRDSRTAWNYAHRNNHSLQNTLEEQFAHKTTAAATAAQTRYLSSPAATTLHGKTQGFVLRLPPQNIAHATFMQPLQCVSQHPVTNLHLSTHVATSKDDNEAAIPMQSATRDSKTAWNYAHRNNHSLQNTYSRRNNSRTKRPQPQQPHRRGTFHRRLQPLYTEKHKVSYSGFLPKT